ncbi:HMG-box, partial [Fomitiporia mediterranea MF3/22]|uniref:HMG-box n=1 Tax=Fomitiporia mediterranea (strain MF3/22) TaxID=694068 RepID=UPI00044077B7
SQSPNHIPRPRNAFILFRSHALARGMVKNIQQNEASREIARIWKSADEGTRKRFEAQAEEEKRIHKLKYPGYRYAPRK